MKKIFFAFLLACVAGVAQAWPTKEITLVVPYPPGGLNDQLARNISVDLERNLNVPVVVKNIPGVSNSAAVAQLTTTKNDNHTFILTDTLGDPSAKETALYREFRPAVVIGTSPLALFGLPASDKKNLTNKLKNQEPVMVAVAGLTSNGGLWLGSLENSKSITRVPYKGAAQMITDTLGGHVDFGLMSMTATYQLVSEGKLQIYMIGTGTRHKKYSNVPTFREFGFNGSDGQTWFALFSKKDTDSVAVRRFTDSVRQVIANNTTIQGLNNRGLDVINLDTKESVAFIDKKIREFEKF
jgi:tripartite-type tricarboxylate transporter receptor subunit TctC